VRKREAHIDRTDWLRMHGVRVHRWRALGRGFNPAEGFFLLKNFGGS